MENQRKFPRVAFRDPVTCRIPGAVPFGENVNRDIGGCVCFDISRGGMRLRTNDFIPLSTEVVFSVPLGKEDVAEVAGKVVWAQKYPHAEQYQIGVRFLDETENFQGKRDLDRMLEQLDPR